MLETKQEYTLTGLEELLGQLTEGSDDYKIVTALYNIKNIGGERVSIHYHYEPALLDGTYTLHLNMLVGGSEVRGRVVRELIDGVIKVITPSDDYGSILDYDLYPVTEPVQLLDRTKLKQKDFECSLVNLVTYIDNGMEGTTTCACCGEEEEIDVCDECIEKYLQVMSGENYIKEMLLIIADKHKVDHVGYREQVNIILPE